MLKKLNLKAARGYGLAMLMVFLGTTVMIGASLQIMATPLTLAYLGGVSQDNMSAQQLAAVGMDLAVADLQSKYDNGQTIDTSYSFTSAANAPSSVLMPQSPDAVTGATSSVGSYTASLPYVNGNTALVSVTATVGSGTYTMSKVVTLSKGIFNTITGATAAYSVRKLNPAYNGSALRVRRISDDAETDIGFDSRGNLDKSALRAFTGTTLPLNSVTSAFRAYSLRKLRAAYSGSAIRVRRSSDSAETDIGFTLSGDLDLSALTDFVGSDSGYITTWYDQSGNGVNATQTTTAAQPAIILSGVLQTVAGKPAIKYDGTDDALRFNRGTLGDDFTILANYSAIAGVGGTGGYLWFSHAGIVDMETSGIANDFGISVDNTGQLYGGIGIPASGQDRSIILFSPGYNDAQMHWLAMTRTKSTGYMTLYTEQGSRSGPDTADYNTSTLNAASQLSIGRLQTNSVASLNGYIPEVIVYTSVLSDTNLKTLQQNAARYWNIPTINAANQPLLLVGSAKGAYGLRKLGSSGTSAIRVRRSSDNTERNINFMNTDLDIADLKSFVGNSSGYVTTWYDQSGSGKNLTQTDPTAQPRIVNAGTVEMLNGKPTMVFDGVNDALFNSAITGHISGTDITTYLYGATNTGIWGRFAVLHKTGDSYEYTTPTSMQFASLTGSANGIQAYTNNLNAVSDVTPNVPFLTTTFHNTSGLQFYLNGSLRGSTAATGSSLAPDYLVVGAGRNGSTIDYFVNGKISELLIYNSAHSSTNRNTIETNISRYLTPQIQTLYVTKWYDQSGNGNDLAQTNPFYQPALIFGSDGTLQSRPSVLFHASNTAGVVYGSFMDSATGFPTNSDYSISSVFSYRTQSLMNNILSSTGVHAFYLAGGTMLNLYHSSAFASSPISISSNKLYAVLGTFVQSSKLGSVYVGSNATAGTGTTANSSTNSDIRMGSHQNGSVFHGTISETIVYNKVLSTTERTNLYNAQTAYFGAQ